MRLLLTSIVAGLLFGAGLMLSGMADPGNVLGFLTVGPDWNPSLALVMGGALLVTAPGFAWVHRRGRLLDGRSFTPVAHGAIDGRLLAGAALFGLGWGLSGYCPGPAVVSAGLGHTDALLLLPALVTGAWLARLLDR
ncbi:MAG: YeeE/YedE family protein [Nevskiaceae bacterium]|nr:MAG: YeeE/YedE family protein [Nevskiaceae bacterium]